VSDLTNRVAGTVTTYTKTIIVIVLLLTAAIGVGAAQIEQESDTGQFETESPAADAQAYIDENFSVQTSEEENGSETATVQLIQRGDDVLTRPALIESLEFQEAIRDTETIASTLTEENAVFGVPNVIGGQAYGLLAERGEAPGGPPGSETGPTIQQQRWAIGNITETELNETITDVLGEGGNSQALGLMPASYDRGSTTAESHLTVITQEIDTEVQNPNQFPEALTTAQLEIREMAGDRNSEYAIFGFGILNDEISQSLGDSGALVGPFALLFVVVALAIAYRDLLDVLLGAVGILLVLVWTFGFMGWANISFNQLLLSVPVLLIGLSIDYAIHVFMRHREQREETGAGVTRGMTGALAGVGVALVWVTATAAIGFLANLTSPIGPLQDFGIVSAFGVFAALLIFGALIPALKIELDEFLEARGFSREKRAFGTSGSYFSKLLASGVAGARRFPFVVVILALLLAAGGTYGATQVDTSFDETDFLADSPPEWTQSLPGPMAPGTYRINEDLEYIGDNYQQEGNSAQVLIRGNVTDDRTLEWINETTEEAATRETVFVGAGGPDIRSPLTVMQRTAARGAGINTTGGNLSERERALVNFSTAYGEATAESEAGVPQGNVAGLFDALLAANPQAAAFVYRSEAGEYEALRIEYGVTGNARISDIADDNFDVAGVVGTESGSLLSGTAASDAAVFDKVQEDLLDTVIQGLIITLVAVFLFLAVAYRLTGNPASLGVVTLIPVGLAVTWILGSMWLLDIPFNTLTGTITSLTVGLGIAYSIHISSRYELELRRQGDVWEAMETTVTGTGGALLGSAATTVGGFGTLAIAILPILQQFGIITGLTIIYAFLASVLVLPALLVLWTRYFGPSGYFPDEEGTPDDAGSTPASERPAADGGEESTA
jgi:predicted RND superfamily exporter protein